ncbi:MBL fold metallo-hydrolase [Sulfurimonas sp. HSL3-7]|uniref:MBL fold metallo-hydrolase n=1 Tax=Sulfonitrofixus jiaomeiensis TaxID=3131938 RepID=UPI0031F76FBD
MTLTFLGTSAGKPTSERNVSALGLTLEQESMWYLFDCGEGTQRQIMKSQLSFGRLGTVFITHLHGDHYFGLPGLLATKKLDGITAPLTIYGPQGIRAFLECAMDLSETHLGYRLEIIEYRAGESFLFDRFTLKVLPLVHSKESVAFYIKEHDITDRLNEAKLRALGLEPSPLYGELKRGENVRFEGKELEPSEYMLKPVIGRSLIIAGDNSTPAVLDDYLEDLDLLVHECTYTQAVYDKLVRKVLHTTAMELGEALQSRGVKNLIANHIDPRYNKESPLDVKMIYDEIKHCYEGKLFIAEDFDVYHLDRDCFIEKL